MRNDNHSNSGEDDNYERLINYTSAVITDDLKDEPIGKSIKISTPQFE